MVEGNSPGRLAIILHADVAGSTAMVQQDEVAAHGRIRDAFQRLREAVGKYSGRVLELRGDALLAEFERPSNAVSAALAFQALNGEALSALDGDMQPEIRIGIAMGEVVVADQTVTGAGVVLAQRIEQLAIPGRVCITAAVHEALPRRMPLDFENLGEQQLKGFEESVRVYAVALRSGARLPELENRKSPGVSSPFRAGVIAIVAVLVIGAGLGYLIQPWRSVADPLGETSTTRQLPDRPSIVVLPFANLYDDGEQDYFVDGMTNGITTYLSKFKQLFVISSTTAFTYKDKSVTARDIGRELGVAYVLEGSILRGAGSLSVQVQLIEAATERHVWAEEYSVAPDEVFSVQAEMISEIVGILVSTLTNEALETVLKSPQASLESYDMYLRARAITRAYTPESTADALGLLNRAIDIAPEFLEAHYYLSELHLNLWRFGRTNDEAESLRLARRHAARVLEIDASDYRGHFLLGNLHLFADHDHDLALIEYQRAHDDNPNDTYVLYYMGFLMSLMGEGEECIKWNDKARRVNPRYPGWFNIDAALCHFWIEDYEQAIRLAKSAMASYPSNLAPRRILIATLVETGRLEDAKREAAEYLEIQPDFRLSTFRNTPFKLQKDQDRYYDAMRQAGIPD